MNRDALRNVKHDRARLVEALRDAGARIDGTRIGCPFHDDRIPSGSVHKGDDGGWRYTCHSCSWNGQKNSGDVVDVVRKARGCTFAEACDLLGLGGGEHRPAGRQTSSDTKAPPEDRHHADATKQATAAHVALLADKSALDHLWRTRGIDRETAVRFGLGITGTPGSRFWTMPVSDGLLKAHRADGQKTKSWWQPKGVNRGHCWPTALEPDGPVWVCPGELKALAVIGLGRAALGITSGEGSEKKPADLPDEAIELLHGREVAIVHDDDRVGRAWGNHVYEQLHDVGLEVRIVDLGLDKSAGLKDIGDWITRRIAEDAKEAAAVAAMLDDAWQRADKWHNTSMTDLWASGKIWEPVTTIPTGIDDLDQALGGGFRTRGVHLLVGKAGMAKSQLALNIALRAAKQRIPTGFLSLELGADEVAQLALGVVASIPRRDLACGKVTPEYADRFGKALKDSRDYPLTIVDDEFWSGGLDRDGLDTLIGEGVARFGWKCVVLDYLGLLGAPDSDGGNFDTDLRNSTAMRKLARRHGVALIVVAALRKATKVEKPEAATLDDVSGAGRLVYDAQTVLLVWRRHGDGGTGFVFVKPLKLRFAPLLEQVVQIPWKPSTGRIGGLRSEEPAPLPGV